MSSEITLPGVESCLHYFIKTIKTLNKIFLLFRILQHVFTHERK